MVSGTEKRFTVLLGPLFGFLRYCATFFKGEFSFLIILARLKRFESLEGLLQFSGNLRFFDFQLFSVKEKCFSRLTSAVFGYLLGL